MYIIADSIILSGIITATSKKRPANTWETFCVSYVMKREKTKKGTTAVIFLGLSLSTSHIGPK